MKTPKPYKLKKRKNGIYYVIDKITKKAKSLKTTDKEEADELAKAEYNAFDGLNASHHMRMAEAHLAHCNPAWNTNTWEMVADGAINGPRRGGLGGEKKPSSVPTLQTLWNNKCWDHMRNKRLIDTLPSDFLRALNNTGAGNLKFGRQLHSYAVGHKMMPAAIMGIDMWPTSSARPVETSRMCWMKSPRTINWLSPKA